MSDEKKLELMAKAEREALQNRPAEPEVVEADDPEPKAKAVKAKRAPKKK